MRAVKMFDVRKPGSIVPSLVTLRIISPDATSSPHDSATSNTTSALLIFPILRFDEPRDSSFRTSLRSARDDWYAGMMPDSIGASRLPPTTNADTGGRG